MKICQSCRRENTDEMSFCLDCGTPLAAAQAPGWLGDAPTTSFGETPTTVRQGTYETDQQQGEFTRPQGGFSVPLQQEGGSTFSQFASPPPARSGKRMYVIIGGVVSLFVLLIVAGAGIVGYNYYTKGQPANTNSNTANGNKTSPNSSPGANVPPTPAPSFTPPTEPTKSGTMTVYASTGWQLSDINTVELEEFRTKVEGKIDIAGVKTGVTSAGVDDAGSKSRRIYPEFPTGALVMRTHYADGKFSNVAAVSANKSTGQWINAKDERGRIEFCINDNAPEKNGGQFTVTVTLTKVPKAKK